VAALLLTLDTNQLDDDRLGRFSAMIPVPHELACVTVSERERGAGLDVKLGAVPETMVWGESRWGEATWGGPISELFVLDESLLDGGAVLAAEGHVDVLESALTIISNGSFPARGERDSLSEGQRRQLRDAMIFEAHVRHRRHALVTDDARGFIKDGRRPKLERLGQTRIVTFAEFEEASIAGTLMALLEPRA
jgi:hypothetical protein